MNRHHYEPPQIAAIDTTVERGFAVSQQNGIENWENQEF